MDNKISFIGGWLLTTATTITGMGLFRAALLGLVGGFTGILGKQLYYYVKSEFNEKAPKLKAKIEEKKRVIVGKVNTFIGKSDRKYEK
jgi:hypothetical protein